ncbi:BET1-LIKE SNARE 1-1 [Salix viminalis]|uniref:BET1-LIKE SNARE 1-1 n=1 Tax=Salix viminalis TaxID=40686 RepID=A0A9Q0ZDZ9_SALVM|nr:BET1-LIKE SNARE 1-1 [Salix viminalis]
MVHETPPLFLPPPTTCRSVNSCFPTKAFSKAEVRTIYTSRICTMVSDQLECNIDASFVYQPSPRIESPLHMQDTVHFCSFRDIRNNRAALFDGIGEGLQDSVSLLKRLSGDINEEVDNHNLMLDRMGNDMDSSRGVLSGTILAH